MKWKTAFWAVPIPQENWSPKSVKDELIAKSLALDLAFQAYKIYLKDTSQRREKSLDHNLDGVSYSEIFALSFFSMICDQKQTQNLLLSKTDAESWEYNNFIRNSMLKNAKLVDWKIWNCSSSASKANADFETIKDQCV
uniref:Uncharacterized protein n=1 Tax=Romanomermis culicivorax TaxID=13658 RepID=A0A915KZW2_ROMCU